MRWRRARRACRSVRFIDADAYMAKSQKSWQFNNCVSTLAFIMRVVTTADLKNRLSSLIHVVEHDPSESVTVERNKCTVDMLLNPEIAEHAILNAYAQGVLTRAVAMQLLGIDWSGDFLQRMNSHGISRRELSAEDMGRMHADANLMLAALQPVEKPNNSFPTM